MKLSFWGAGLFLLLPLMAFSQKEDTQWYFGRNAALDFSSGSAVVKSDNALSSTGASATMCDKNTGALLFYTDGKTVFTKTHIPMVSGTGLISDIVAKDVTIVPFPDDDNKYYIFSVEGTGNLKYSIVDMSLNGGLGQVTSGNNFLFYRVMNKITAVKNSLKKAYWLITYAGSVANDTFNCFDISTSGINTTPVRTVTGFFPKINTLGAMKTSHDGKKLVLTFYDANKAVANVYDFDKACGYVSTSPKSLYTQSPWDRAYGIAFSPDDTKLYISYSYQESQLIQYSGDFSGWTSITTSIDNINGLQTAPDGKLYISTHDGNIPSSRVDVLHQPNNFGAACQYQKAYLDLGAGRNSYFDFPNFINDKSVLGNGNTAAEITFKNTCIGDVTEFKPANFPLFDSLRWDFGDPPSGVQNTAIIFEPTHKYPATGNYNVKLKWTYCSVSQTINKTVTIYNNPTISLGQDTAICYGDSVTLKSGITGAAYTWSDGSTKENLTVGATGNYWVKVDLGSCGGADTISVKIYPKLTLDAFEKEYFICDEEGDTLKLDAGKGYAKYQWLPGGDTTQTITLSTPGSYVATITDLHGCKAADTALVSLKCGFVFHMPDAFTPNNDGLNEVFVPMTKDIEDYHFEIFNRWGQMVFSTEKPTDGWDGSFKTEPCPVDFYIWKLRFRGVQNKIVRNFEYRGTVKLVR